MSGGLGDNGCSISFFCKADEVAGVVAFQVDTVFKSPVEIWEFNSEKYSNHFQNLPTRLFLFVQIYKAKFSVVGKVENISEGSLDLILSPSPSVKIQIMFGTICLSCKGKTMLLF